MDFIFVFLAVYVVTWVSTWNVSLRKQVLLMKLNGEMVWIAATLADDGCIPNGTLLSTKYNIYKHFATLAITSANHVYVTNDI